ncbi:DUF1491 family protein [Sphingomonas sp. HITSZ_GF]|uniref:DUF1491 family protein n=1 Tax=Sphingomonas sp. HITSZ_GF TaxID=3037247 RepID=UPI00240D84BB|nr:DUF1491 family protein [Sphingomonas sp. HITSZ_GF]MDG2533644.1 DUF1491 family protein [Sphingomonas sp. HITSZ_GF]
MTPRLATGMLVNALIRRAEGAGGGAMVLAKGDATAGAVLLLLVERGANPRFIERGLGPDGKPALIPAGPRDFEDDTAVTAYWQRRRNSDSDLWVVELDIADGERFAAETMAAN